MAFGDKRPPKLKKHVGDVGKRKDRITEEEISSVISINKREPKVIAYCGKDRTMKSTLLLEEITRIPGDTKCVLLDYDRSLSGVLEKYYPKLRGRVIFLDPTKFGKGHEKKGLKTALLALDRVVKTEKIGLLAIEGIDKLYHKSFVMTCDARGYDIDEISFFGKGGNKKFNSMDWFIRNHFNSDPFEALLDYADTLQVPLIITTHTKDEIDQQRNVTEENVPVMYKTIPDDITERWILTRSKETKVIEDTRYNIIKIKATCDKSRWDGILEGTEFIIMERHFKFGMRQPSKIEFYGLHKQVDEYLNIPISKNEG